MAVPGEAPQASEHSPLYRLAGLVLAAFVFAVNVYRAANQSITADEAFNYDLYIGSPLDWLVKVYDASNHVLHTLLCRLSVDLFGLSELTMRLPSLLGGLLYLVFVYKLCAYLFKTWWTFLLALSALTLNPFVMDYLSAARGYSMALGLFTTALYLDTRFLDNPSAPARYDRVGGAALLLGLSISANLIFLFPATALAGTLTVLLLADSKQAEGWKKRLLWIADRVWLRMIVLPVLLLAIPIAHARPGSFSYGVPSLRGTALSLVGRSLFHQYDIWTVGPGPPIVIRTVFIATNWIVPLMLVVLLVTLAPICWTWLKQRDFRRLAKLDRAFLLTGAVAAIALVLLVAAHALAGIMYPSDRTAIYLALLLPLAWMLLIERALSAPRIYRALGLLASAPVAAAIFLFLRGFTTSYYYEWRYDAGTKHIFQLLQKQVAQRQNRFSGSNPMKVGINWRLNYSLNFYRRMYKADWLAQVERDPAPETGGFDYYVLLPQDRDATRKLGLRVIYHDAISTEEIAVPGTFPVLASRH